MIGNSATAQKSPEQSCYEFLGLAVFQTLRQYGKVRIRQNSETEMFFIPEGGKHFQITSQEDRVFLFCNDLEWNKDLQCYVLNL
jgi:hypothetical protein